MNLFGEKVMVVNKRLDDFDVYIGRGSKWGNRFVIGVDGDRDMVIKKYEKWIRDNEYLMGCLKNGELVGKVMGCFCKNKGGGGLGCHGDILIKIMVEMGVM